MSRVIIVGGGCAGLSAAYELKKQGVDFTLYERSKYAGGRCRTDPEDGYEFYVGAGSTEPQWETSFTYLRELGLLDRIFTVGGMRFGFVRRGKIYTCFLGKNLGDSIRALPENIRFFFRAIPFRTYFQLFRIFPKIKKYLKRIDAENKDYEALSEISDLSTEEFCIKYNAPLVSEWIFHTLLALMVLARPKDISIAHPLTLFSLMQGMCSLEGGMGVITASLYEQVKDNVRLNTAVKKVVLENNKVIGVELEDGFVEADQVIVGLDAVDVINTIPDLPDTMRLPLQSCKYSSSWYYQFGLEKPLINKKDTPMYIVMIPPEVDTFLSYVSLGSSDKEKPIALTPTRGWEDERLAGLSPEERRRKVIDEVRKFVPYFPEEPKITKAYRWDRAVNIEAPGQHNMISEMIENHMDDVKGLYLSGEYLFLLACTEGALSTGKQAAEKAIDDQINKRI